LTLKLYEKKLNRIR